MLWEVCVLTVCKDTFFSGSSCEFFVHLLYWSSRWICLLSEHMISFIFKVFSCSSIAACWVGVDTCAKAHSASISVSELWRLQDPGVHIIRKLNISLIFWYNCYCHSLASHMVQSDLEANKSDTLHSGNMNSNGGNSIWNLLFYWKRTLSPFYIDPSG